MADAFLGEIRPFAFNFVPTGYMVCAGQLLSISQWSALFAVIGTQYGGNGTSNFALPNLQGYALISQGQSPGFSDYVMGEILGTPTVSLLSTEIPFHSHVFSGATVAGGLAVEVVQETNAPGNGVAYLSNLVGTTSVGSNVAASLYNVPPINTSLNALTVAVAGGSQPHENMSPYMAITYCIAVSGQFPARN